MPNIGFDHEGRKIDPTWAIGDRQGGAFTVCAPFRDGLHGSAILGRFGYRPHARLAAQAPAMADAMNRFCDRVEKGEVRSKRTYAEFCEILDREPKT